MTASALALILLSDSGRASRREWIAAAGLSAIAAAGVIARDTQPPAPDTYQGMIHATSG